MTQENKTEVNELVLFATNDGDLYRQKTTPIIKNLAKKKVKGVYAPEKALVLWGYLADNAAQKYTRMHCEPKPATSYGPFTAVMRREAAKALATYYADELESN
jgi:hypothetical protein